MKALTFAKPSLMTWNNTKISDHNRSELGIGVERIETKKRMANGTMRKYVVADKKTFSVNWTDLPHSKDFTVDGFWGGKEIEAFYALNAGAFSLKIFNGDGSSETYNVFFSDFTKNIKKRGLYDFWDINLTMEEM